MTGVSDWAEAVKAAQHLSDALMALNSADGPLANQQPTTPYSRASKALSGVLEELASQAGLSHRKAEQWADLVYVSGHLDQSGIAQAIEFYGTPEVWGAEPEEGDI